MIGVFHYKPEVMSDAWILQNALVEAPVVISTETPILHYLEIKFEINYKYYVYSFPILL